MDICWAFSESQNAVCQIQIAINSLGILAAATFSGKMMTSPVEAFSTRGSPFDSRQVYGGNVTSLSPGYCETQVTPKWMSAVKRDRFHETYSLDMFTIENGLMSPPIWVRPTLISTTMPLPLA